MANGRRFRVLNITGDMTHECLGAIPDTSISGKRVARELTAIIGRRGKPGMIVSDNGTELTSNAIFAWAKDHKIDWHYIAPGKPMQNGSVEKLQRQDARRTSKRRRRTTPQGCSSTSSRQDRLSLRGWRTTTPRGHTHHWPTRRLRPTPKNSPQQAAQPGIQTPETLKAAG